MEVRHYNIPVFIPEIACPHRCVFCNQETITGIHKAPKAEEVKSLVMSYLSTINRKNTEIKIAFFGGSFTGLPIEIQEDYLKSIQPLIVGNITGIRISTRPDYINFEGLQILKKYHVSNIELGAQSMDDEVLRLSGRGHDHKKVLQAAELIKSQGFQLGLQMMIGLPGDSFEKAMETARLIVNAGADETRIYPTLVIKDTVLEQRWLKGSYQPLTLEEAVRQSSELYKYFEKNKIKILRVGLYPSEELVDNSGFLAGPFHNSFKELVMSEIWKDILKEIEPKTDKIILKVPVKEFNFANGYKKSNWHFLKSKFLSVKFIADTQLKNREFHVDYL
ncbi:MAG: hypothetical protein AUJ98_10665 [Bacteroidetes bacterium CG2_30_33_31]|nr:MAG: hypothetical protein AUJ98_10665 [Bacteroidetes bacterium CG2_30_33_31]